MNHPRRCPVCDQLWGASCSELPSSRHDASHFQCEVCGTFRISGTALATTFDPANSALTEIPPKAAEPRLHLTCKFPAP